MLPPDCFICHEDKGCKLLYFKKSVKQKLREFKFGIMEFFGRPRIVGHPDHAGWYCKKHYPLAKKYENLVQKEALEKIDKELKK